MHVRVLLAVAVAGFASAYSLAANGEDRLPGRGEGTELALAYQPDADGKQPAKSDAKGEDPKKADSKAAAVDNPTIAAFRAKLGDWKQLLVDTRQKQFEYKAAKPEEQKKIEEQFNQIKAAGIAMQGELQKLAEQAYLSAPNKDDEVTAFLTSAIVSASNKDDYDEVLRLANVLIDNGFSKKAVYTFAGVAAFNLGDFETAEKDLKIAEEAKVLDQLGKADLDLIDGYKAKWEKEKEIRAAEARANDLPRVELKTTKGNIVVELFENEAPNTVANFISLVQKGFYKDSDFHRVIRGFMAQGGSPKGEADGGPGYTIADECKAENHRLHFRGTLSMAKTAKPDTGGSQFFLTFVPTPHLDGEHTVFGRVVEGMDVLNELTRRDPQGKNQPPADSILEAKVLRKRSHPYQPKTISDADAKAAAEKASPAKGSGGTSGGAGAAKK